MPISLVPFLFGDKKGTHTIFDAVNIKKEPPPNGGVHKTVNGHNSLVCCDRSCIFDQIMIAYNQLNKLEFDETLI